MAAVRTQDINRALHVSWAMKAGRMWVTHLPREPCPAPFGGYKKVGLGRETTGPCSMSVPRRRTSTR
ncbi:aldehyde dehydrogenase family protein [Rhodococcus ruber]|uniref:aldehyde dehydrogenase family protein n=1 Tax=Rhodococcus ruber TaxID=1830 RepID=UPI003F535FA6